MNESELKSWERYVFGFDVGDADECVVTGVYNVLTGKLKTIGVDFVETTPALFGHHEPKL